MARDVILPAAGAGASGRDGGGVDGGGDGGCDADRQYGGGVRARRGHDRYFPADHAGEAGEEEEVKEGAGTEACLDAPPVGVIWAVEN